MKGDPISYILQVLVGRESEYKQVGKTLQCDIANTSNVLRASAVLFPY